MGQTEHPAAVQADPDRAELDRADPQCPHFGPCGGCQLQHLAYAAQLRRKAAQLRALLPAAGFALPELQIHPSPPLAYRNRIRLTLAEVSGQLRAGYIRNLSADWSREEEAVIPGGARQREVEGPPHVSRTAGEPTPTFLPITQCPIAAPILWRAAEAFLALANRQPGLWLRSPRHTLDQLELFTAADESRLQLSLYLRTAAQPGKKTARPTSGPSDVGSAFTALCEALRTRIPELTGAGIFLLPPRSTQRSRRAEQPRPGPTWGAPGLSYSVSQLTTNNQQLSTSFWIPRGAFFQVNRFLLPELLALVVPGLPTATRATALAWDLYAGVGLFARALAARFAQVTAVEIAEPAATALAATGLANLRAVKATTLDFLRAAVVERDRPSLVVLDPPRSGADREVCELLGRIAAPALVYVSCAPEVLPADLVTLAAAGYAVRELHLFDLFPQTAHIETVAILSRDHLRAGEESPTR